MGSDPNLTLPQSRLNLAPAEVSQSPSSDRFDPFNSEAKHF